MKLQDAMVGDRILLPVPQIMHHEYFGTHMPEDELMRLVRERDDGMVIHIPATVIANEHWAGNILLGWRHGELPNAPFSFRPVMFKLEGYRRLHSDMDAFVKADSRGAAFNREVGKL